MTDAVTILERLHSAGVVAEVERLMAEDEAGVDRPTISIAEMDRLLDAEMDRLSDPKAPL